MNNENKIFADGVMFKPPHEKAPDFIIGKLSVKLPNFTDFANKHVNERGWVNMEIKKNKDGKYYVELDTYQPKPRGNEQGQVEAPPSLE